MPRKRIWAVCSGKKRQIKKAGYLQIVTLDFKLPDLGRKLGTFESRVQRSNHSTNAASIEVLIWRRDATSHLLFRNQSVLADFDDSKKNICTLRLVAFQARVMKPKPQPYR